MKTYSFRNVVMLINGVEVTGWPEGEDLITCERINDSASHMIGADGSMTVNISADRSGTITFSLKQNSESNALLTGLITAQENGAFVPVFIQVMNTEGGELVSGTRGYLTKPGNVSFGETVSSVEWVVTVERLDIINTGSGAA